MERIVYFAFLAFAALAVTDAALTTRRPRTTASPTGPPGQWFSHNGTKYFFSTVRTSWTEGQAVCREVKGTLVEPYSDDLNEWLASIAINELRDGMFWTGLIRQNHSFQWQSGVVNPHRNWQQNEPADDVNAWAVSNVAGFWYATEPFDVLMPVCQQIPDVCEPNPCLNGGQCYADLDKEWHCMCPEGFFGTTCELVSSPACPENDTDGYWLLHDSKCFYFQTQRQVTWTQAQKECHAKEGTLVEILDKEIGQYVNAQYQPCSTPTECKFWIGLAKQQAYGQSFSWLSGHSLDFSSWATDQPAGIGWCTRTVGDGNAAGVYAWDAQPCVTVNAGYVCQRTIIHNFAYASTEAPASTTEGPSTAAAETTGSPAESTTSGGSATSAAAPRQLKRGRNHRAVSNDKAAIVARWEAMHQAAKKA